MNLTGMIIGLGFIMTLIILAVFFRKAITLSLVRMIYGQFSFEFYHIYKKYFVRSPHQYCFRDEFFSHLLYVILKKDDIPSYKSSKEIYFENTHFFINYKDFLKDKGNPYCFNAFAFNEPDFVIKALGYQAMKKGNKATLVYYFINDSFFMGEYIFKNPRNDIKSLLIDNFLEMKDISADNFYIENTKDRIIHYQDTGFTIEIKYLSKENPEIVEKLNQYFLQMTGKKVVIEA